MLIRTLALIPVHVVKNIIQITPNSTGTLQITPNSTGTLQITPNSTGSLQITPNSTGSLQITPNSLFFREVPNPIGSSANTKEFAVHFGTCSSFPANL
ncbi:hypothetical protein AVEN_44685-1, partial [Araneus ventricosus]